MIDPDMALDYLGFVSERHRVWERRQEDPNGPWTDDPVLAACKFTNVFRVLDPGSQWPMRHLYYGEDRAALEHDPAEALFRAFMFRFTNRPEPWLYFRDEHGRFPLLQDLEDGTLLDTWMTFWAAGGRVFTRAYRISAGALSAGTEKVGWVVGLAEQYMLPGGPDYLGDTVLEVDRAVDQAGTLLAIPRCGEFMTQQVLTDLRYAGFGRCLDEDEYTPLGPGAATGASWISPSPEADPRGLWVSSRPVWAGTPEGRRPVQHVLRWAHDALHEMDNCPTIPTRSGRLHKPTMMDVQNTLCEFGKYVKYRDKPEMRRIYRPTTAAQPSPVLPQHW